MAAEEMYLNVDVARAFCQCVFEAVGVPPDDASLITDNLIEADLRGLGSHGISRLLVYSNRLKNGWVNPKPDFRILHERSALVHLDGDNGAGAVIGTRAMEMCIERARQTGVAICSVTNANHFGIASFYTMRAAAADMIGIASSNNPPNMAPWGGSKAMIGTNPFSIAVPAAKHPPMVMDMSSSIVARGRINLAEIEGKPIPLGWAIDSKGRPTTEATEALKGAVLPFGQHKGYAIGLMVDVFSGILSGAAFSVHVGQLWNNNASKQNLGLFLSAIDVSATGPVSEFKARVDQLIDELKACEPAEGFSEVLVPGEIELQKEVVNREKGIPIGAGVLRDLRAIQQDLKIDVDLKI